jgi:hypothetical protein
VQLHNRDSVVRAACSNALLLILAFRLLIVKLQDGTYHSTNCTRQSNYVLV